MPKVKFKRGCKDCKKTTDQNYSVEWPNRFELYDLNGILKSNESIKNTIVIWHKVNFLQCEMCDSFNLDIYNISVDGIELVKPKNPIDIVKNGSSIGFKFDFSVCNYYRHSSTGKGIELSSASERDNGPIYLIIDKSMILLLYQHNGGFIKRIEGPLKNLKTNSEGLVSTVIGTSDSLGMSNNTEFIITFNKAPLISMTTTPSMALLSVKGNTAYFEPEITMEYALNNSIYLGEVNFNG